MGLNLMVTGAAGFLGRAVVAAGLARGHAVQAVVRRPADLPEGAVTQICDLTEATPDLTGIDAVIHCAASLTGDDAAQQRDTVQPTEALIRAIAAQPTPPRLVLVSSLSVYDYTTLAPGAALTEATPLETDPRNRDAYTRAKLAQEATARSLSDCWLIRAGLIYGPGRTWNAHIGAGLGPILLRIGGSGELPLIHLQNCAEALIHAAETPATEATPLNIIGDDRPSRTAFLAAHRMSGWPRLTLPLPWQVLLLAGRILAPLPGLPGLLRPATLKARMMPLRYPNAAAKAALNWSPRIPFAAGMAAALEGA